MEDPRLYMAAERTFLAWIRTSISLITFGFVLEKFDYFLKEISVVIHERMSSSPHIKGIGISFIIVGILTLLIGVFIFIKSIKDLERGTYKTQTKVYMSYAVMLITGIIVLVIVLISLGE